jgi:hypothetical protein
MHVAMMQIVRKAPENNDHDICAYDDGHHSVADDLMDIVSCVDVLANQAESRQDTGLTFSPSARVEIHQALELLRKANCRGLVAANELKCPTCGKQNNHGLPCRDCDI